MRFWAMRFIDYWIGRPLCLLLTLLRRLIGLAGSEDAALPAPERVLFIKLEEQGALVLAAPAVKRAEAKVGRENLYFCVFAENRPILDAMNIVPPENIITIRTENVFEIFWDTLRAIAAVRRARVDAIIDLEFFARGSAVLAYLCGGTRRVGLHSFGNETPYRGDLMTHRMAYNPYLHTAQAYDVMVRALDEAPANVPLLKQLPESGQLDAPEYAPPQGDVERVRGLLALDECEDGPGPVIVLHPNCSDVLRVRKWPSDRYVVLARQIIEKYPDALIVFTGLENEQDEIERLASEAGTDRAISLAGKISLRELLALLSFADVLVTNDSGPAHFAALTPIHQVSLFGPETPQLFQPLGLRTRVLYTPLACSPCLTTFNYRHSVCNDNVCVQTISVEDVLAEVAGCIAERGQG